MALEIKNITATITSVSCLLDIAPPVYHTNWSYSLNGGAWVLYSQTDAYRINCTISGLKENTTYSLRARATNSSTFVTTYSDTVNFKTAKNQVAPTITVSFSGVSTTGFTINAIANYECKDWTYSIDGGGWQSMGAGIGSAANKAITGLTPGKTYTVKVHGKRTYNDVSGWSNDMSVTTVGGAILNSANTIIMDASTVGVTFNWTLPSGGGFTYDLRIVYGATTVVTKTGITGSSGNKTENLTTAQKNTLLGLNTTAKSITVAVVIDSKYGGTLVSSSSKIVTATTTEENSKPTFASFTHSEQNAKVIAVNPGGYVQSLSNIKIVCNGVSAKSGASIVKHGAVIGNKVVEVDHTTTTINFGAPLACGEDYTITAYVEDSRGYRTTLTQTRTIWCYTGPVILEWAARRKDSTEAQTALTVMGTIRTTPNNALKSARYRIKPPGGDWPEVWTALEGLTNLGLVSPGRRGYKYENDSWATLDTDKTYGVQIQYQDLYEEYSLPVQFNVDPGIPLMAFRAGKVGINTSDPQAGLDVNDGLIVDGVSVSDRLEGIGKLLRFRANVTVTKSTFSASTGFHYQQLAVDIPAGYTGNTSAQWAQVQVLSGGIWLVSPISVTTTKVNFYIAMGVAWDFSASPLTYPAIVAVSII